MNTMRKNLAWALLAALSLTACEKEGDTDNGPVELRLTSGVEVQTKATHGLDTKIMEERSVYVWVDNANKSTDVSAGTSLYNVLLQQGANGTLSNEDHPMYFPQDGNAVNIYACRGGSHSIIGGAYPAGVSYHSVSSDQRSNTPPSGYGMSDLLYAKVTNAPRTTPSVLLTFHHLLSKVEVVLMEGAGDEGFLGGIESVKILNTVISAGFTLGKDKPAYGKNKENENGIEITTNGDTTTDIQIDADVTPKGVGYTLVNEAIIVPQPLADETEFIQITLKNGGKFTYKLEEETTFESGKKYLYGITANQTDLSVTSEIKDWDNCGGATGEASM